MIQWKPERHTICGVNIEPCKILCCRFQEIDKIKKHVPNPILYIYTPTFQKKKNLLMRLALWSDTGGFFYFLFFAYCSIVWYWRSRITPYIYQLERITDWKQITNIYRLMRTLPATLLQWRDRTTKTAKIYYYVYKNTRAEKSSNLIINKSG